MSVLEYMCILLICENLFGAVEFNISIVKCRGW